MAIAMTLLAAPALAQTEGAAQGTPAPPQTAVKPPEATPVKRATITVGADFTSAYMFRGILQADSGAIVQPYVDIGVALGKGVSVNFGNWESHHSVLSGKFYESDYYASVTATAGKWKPGALFTSYTSPKDAFHMVQEIAGVLAYDDSARAVPFSPKFIVAQELTSGQADGGHHKGTYFEAGARPTIKLIKAKTPLNLAIPAKLGLCVHDYYEGVNGGDTFGYLDIGAIASIPFSTARGIWEVHGGVDFLTLGDNLKTLNAGDRVKPVVSVGFSYVY
jgi:hypothetical protein